MVKSLKSELTERINTAHILLKKGSSKEQANTLLMARYGVSKRQAYRYIQEALKAERILPIPEAKDVLTVKLPISLIFRVREFSKSSGQPLSILVMQALEAFLKRMKHGR